MDTHSISCVLSDIPAQVTGVQWTTSSNTPNVYTPQDGTISGTSQTSTLSLSSSQLENLKMAGDTSSFTCKILVGIQDTAVSASQTVNLFNPGKLSAKLILVAVINDQVLANPATDPGSKSKILKYT